jgi:hypothetical protein
LWIQRFRRLAERGHLPTRTFVPLSLPSGQGRLAADDVTRELNQLGVETADFNDESRVRALAQV